MCRSTIVASLELGSVEDLAAGSSPTIATTPPWRAVPGEHAVADRVVGPVEPGRLAVPEAEHAVVLALWAGVGELAAHDRGGCELLVHAGPHDHGKIGDRPGGAAQLLLQRAHGRALVPGRKRGRVQSVAAVDAQLVDRQPSHGLHA